MHQSVLPALAALTVANILDRADVHSRGKKHLAIIERYGRPVNLFRALT